MRMPKYSSKSPWWHASSCAYVVPPAFYLVVVEDGSSACHDLSGAWPVGVIRSTKVPSTATTSPSGPSQG